MFSHILLVFNMFRSPLRPSTGCFITRMQLIYDNSKKMCDKTTQCYIYLSVTNLVVIKHQNCVISLDSLCSIVKCCVFMLFGVCVYLIHVM